MKQKTKTKQHNTDVTKYRFLYDYILLRAIKADSVEGLVSPSQYEDKPEFGIVIAMGEGRLMEDGTVVPLLVKVGDTVLFGKYSTEPIRSKGEDYYLIREEDVKGVAPNK